MTRFNHRRVLSFKPGQWVDAGYYVTGQVVDVDPNNSNYVSVRFGSETINLSQRLTPMKPASEEPNRSLRNIFRPGQWIQHDKFGVGTILTVTDIKLIIRFAYLIKGIAPSRNKMYVVPLDIPDTDMTDSIEARRAFFDTHPDHNQGMKSCVCCGYPTQKDYSIDFCEDEYPDPCIVCGWTNTGNENPRPEEMATVDDISEEINNNYSLETARNNFKTYQTMYCPEDVTNFIRATDNSKKELASLFDSLITEENRSKISVSWEAIKIKMTQLQSDIAR